MNRFILMFIALSSFLQADVQRAQFYASFLNKAYALFKKATPQLTETPSIKIGFLPIRNTDLEDYRTIFIPLKAFAENPTIDCIVLDIDSWEGSAALGEILAELFREIQKVKPLIAFVSGCALNYTYFLTAATSYIIALHTTHIGNIGYALEYSFDKNNKVTLISSGKYKEASFNEQGDLDPDFLSLQKARVEALAHHFFEHVESTRKVPLDIIKNLEGRMVTGRAALDIGLIDEVGGITSVIKKVTADIEAKNNTHYEKIQLIDRDNKTVMTFDTIH